MSAPLNEINCSACSSLEEYRRIVDLTEEDLPSQRLFSNKIMMLR